LLNFLEHFFFFPFEGLLLLLSWLYFYDIIEEESDSPHADSETSVRLHLRRPDSTRDAFEEEFSKLSLWLVRGDKYPLSFNF